MVNYRRNYVKGASYFFTLTLYNRKNDYLIRHHQELKIAYTKVKNQKPFKTIAYAIMPDHYHLLWQLPKNDTDYPGRLRAIKKAFTKAIRENDTCSIAKKTSSSPIWQNRYWEHTIKDEIDMEQHINYIHFNPVKHGMVKQALEWPYSSFHAYVQRGLLPIDWAGREEHDNRLMRYGE